MKTQNDARQTTTAVVKRLHVLQDPRARFDRIPPPEKGRTVRFENAPSELALNGGGYLRAKLKKQARIPIAPPARSQRGLRS